jgi:hypothetical protein
MATSFSNSSAQWAVIPMGHLRDTSNTFWQLMVRPFGQSRWSDATNFGVATNGGLSIASPGDDSLTVGTHASHLLRFSSLAQTRTSGLTWRSVPPVPSLANVASALAQSQDGSELALIGKAGTASVLAGNSHASTWRTLTTTRSFASQSVARSCQPLALTAVGESSAGALLGARCSNDGVVGLYAYEHNGWRALRVPVPTSLRARQFSVVATENERGTSWLLLAATSGHGAQLVAAWSNAPLAGWHVIVGPRLGRSTEVQSIGSNGAGLFALWGTGSGERASQVGLSGWRSVPPPPPGTQTLSYGPGNSVQALTVRNTLLRVFTLTSTNQWHGDQRMSVPLQFGSSQ